MTREIGLNNPMGLRISTDRFQGEIQPSLDEDFKTFFNLTWGVRAGVKVLLTYYNVHALDTVSKIINRWAPESENDTDAYIQDVCNRMNVSANDILDLTNQMVMCNLVSAIVWHENGELIEGNNIIAGVSSAYA